MGREVVLLEICMSSKCEGYAQKGEAEISEEAEHLVNSAITLPISLRKWRKQ